MKRRCIVVGCGWAGAQHAQAVADSPAANLVALVEPSASRSAEMAARFGVPVYASIADALAQVEFDAAIVATLPMLHYDQCRLLLENGKDVLSEKPLCRTSEEIAELMAIARSKGVQLGVLFNQRYGKAVQMARQLLEQDKTERQLVTASMYQNFHVYRGPHIHETFVLTDSCCHLLDLVTYLAGPIKTGSAIGKMGENGFYTDVAATLEFEAGHVGTMAHSCFGGALDTQHPFQQIDIHTRQAHYVVDSLMDRLTVYPHDGQMRQIYEPSVFERRDYALTLKSACQAFLQALHDRKPLPESAQDALCNTQLIETLCRCLHRDP